MAALPRATPRRSKRPRAGLLCTAAVFALTVDAALAATPDQASVQVGAKINARGGRPDELDFFVGSAGSPSFPFTELDRVASMPDYDNDGIFMLLMILSLIALAGVPLVITLFNALESALPGGVLRQPFRISRDKEQLVLPPKDEPKKEQKSKRAA